MKRRVLIALAIFVPGSTFGFIREMATWRPKLMTADSLQNSLFSSATRSPSGRWIVSSTTAGTFLWDRQQTFQRRALTHADGMTTFSRDESLVGMVWAKNGEPANRSEPYFPGERIAEAQILNLKTGGMVKLQSVDCQKLLSRGNPLKFSDGIFSPDNRVFSVLNFEFLLRWDVASGQLISKESRFWNGFNFLADDAHGWGSFRAGASIVDLQTGQRKVVHPTFGDLIPGGKFFQTVSNSPPYDLEIRRVADDRLMWSIGDASVPQFTPDGGTVFIAKKNAISLIIRSVEVASGRAIASHEFPFPSNTNWTFDDDDHILTLDNKGRVYRWRLR